MTDPMMRVTPPRADDDYPLFGTSHAAGAIAAGSRRHRYQQILRLLAERGELACFQAADLLGVGQNQISGRFAELARDGLIEPTGRVVRNPATGAPAALWRIRPTPCVKP